MSGGLPAVGGWTEERYPSYKGQTTAARPGRAVQPRRPPVAMFNEKTQSRQRSRSQDTSTPNSTQQDQVRSHSAHSVRKRNPILAITEDGGPSLLDVKSDMMVKWIYEELLRRQYASGIDAFEGVVVKKTRGHFACYPQGRSSEPSGFFAMAAEMNVRVRRLERGHSPSRN